MPFTMTGEILVKVTATPDLDKGVSGKVTKSDGAGRVELTVTRAQPVTIITRTTAMIARGCPPILPGFVLD
jgi:hypothetical protein